MKKLVIGLGFMSVISASDMTYLVIHLSWSLLCKNHLAAARDMLRRIPGREPLAMGLI